MSKASGAVTKKDAILILLVAVVLTCAIVLPVYADDDAEDIAARCAEAEERYQASFGAPSSETEGVTVVLMYDYLFCPAQITVPVGTTIRWVNVDKRTSHSVIVGQEPESDRAFPEEAIEHTFDIAGPVDYLCGPHWERRGMIGSVIVE